MAPLEATSAVEGSDNNDSQAGDAIAILYGSQTGNAEEVAWDLARQGRRNGFACGDPQALNDLGLQGLTILRTAVFVVATTGQGDPPSNMRHLWQELLRASLPKTLLSGLRFAVFGLGDRHYREFNYAARKLHERLRRLGAEPFVRLGLGDDQHDFGFEQELDPWAESLWAALAKFEPPRPALGEAAAMAAECRYEVEELGEGEHEAPVSAGGGATFEAQVLENRCLCTEAHARQEQDVRNVRLRVDGASYVAGDVCAVWPRTEPSLVRRFVVETLGLRLQTRVRIRPRRRTASPFPDVPLTLEQVFGEYIDISAVPARHFFHVLAMHTEDAVHGQKLSEFASRTLEAKDALYEYCKQERRTAAEVMWDFWTARPPLAELLSALPLMRPRRYSIASSPQWHSFGQAIRFWLHYRGCCGPAWRPRLTGRAVESACAESAVRQGGGDCIFDLCVGVVRFKTRTGREGEGLCSGFLARSAPASRLHCSFERGSLALPPLDVPLLLICPGTGLSPCRALVQQRHLEVAGTATGGRFAAGLKDMLFLGFRHRDGDYLYEGEWAVHEDWLQVHIAFSRDHEDKKVYVQDLIEEHGQDVCRLLDAGARIFVCGRSHPMPGQVFDALAEALCTHRGLSVEQAGAKLLGLQRAQRYICDTWG